MERERRGDREKGGKREGRKERREEKERGGKREARKERREEREKGGKREGRKERREEREKEKKRKRDRCKTFLTQSCSLLTDSIAASTSVGSKSSNSLFNFSLTRRKSKKLNQNNI